VEIFLEFSVDFRGDFDCQKDEFSGGFGCLLCLLKIFTSDVIEFYYSLIFTSVSVVWTSVCLGEFFRLFSLVNKTLGIQYGTP